MTNIIQRKYKASRRLGVNLWGRAKDPFNTRNYPPGQHGSVGFKKTSDFGKQFVAHQKFKCYYRMLAGQMKNLFLKANKKRGDKGDNFVGLLESRLSSVLFTSGLVPTMDAARQIISHKHVTVNDKIVNIRSYTVKPGDVVKIRERAWGVPVIVASSQSFERRIPDYLEVDIAHKSVKFIRVPKFSDVLYPAQMELNLVIEFYSK